MRKKTQLSLGGIILAVLAALLGPRFVGGLGVESGSESARTTQPQLEGNSGVTSRAIKDKPRTAGSLVKFAEIGFRSRTAFDEHYQKHGHEFGNVTQHEYLRLAQELRDRPVGKDLLEIVRDDGVASRFDKQTGGFLAFNKDLTLRTFFKPSDGVSYFERQSNREH